jgi:hypothetical protein
VAANLTNANSVLPPIPPLPIPSALGPVASNSAVAATVAAAAVPDTAGMTSAFAAAAPKHAAQDSAMFHGLFSDPGRGPIAAVVSQLWGPAGLASGGGDTPSAGAMRDLFKDDGSRGT